MPKICTCGHSYSQHHRREPGGKKVCDYIGLCGCTGYKHGSTGKTGEMPTEEDLRKEAQMLSDMFAGKIVPSTQSVAQGSVANS